MKKSEVRQNAKSGQKDEKPIKVSFLLNSIYYFIEWVFIMAVKDGYRLVAINQATLLTDKTYKTFRGARIAFFKLYGNQAYKKGVKTIWSHIYTTLPGWCDMKIKGKKTW